jgi:hypothetical protein
VYQTLIDIGLAAMVNVEVEEFALERSAVVYEPKVC